jgi:dihydrolipoamide dehydrogenase
MKTAIIEKYATLGGTCLNVGCIPSKALLASSHHYEEATKHFEEHGIEIPGEIKVNLEKMIGRKQSVVDQTTGGIDFLMKKNNIDVFEGLGSFKDATHIKIEGKDAQEIEAKNIIIATGSKPAPLKIEGDKILQIEGMLNRIDIPQNLAILGSGAVAVELSQLFRMMDRNVTLLTEAEKLVPGLDSRLEEFIKGKFKKDKINIAYDFDIQEDGIYIKNNLTEFDLIINASLRQSVLPQIPSELKLERGMSMEKISSHIQHLPRGLQ